MIAYSGLPGTFFEVARGQMCLLQVICPLLLVFCIYSKHLATLKSPKTPKKWEIKDTKRTYSGPFWPFLSKRMFFDKKWSKRP